MLRVGLRRRIALPGGLQDHPEVTIGALVVRIQIDLFSDGGSGLVVSIELVGREPERIPG